MPSEEKFIQNSLAKVKLCKRAENKPLSAANDQPQSEEKTKSRL